MSRERSLAFRLLPIILVVGACTSSAGASPSPVPTLTVIPTVVPVTTPAVTPALSPTAAPAATAAGSATVEAKAVGTIGTVLVAGSNSMTVYNFARDVKDSGTSACTGGCVTNWPPLTVTAGQTPTAGVGVTGTLGTITRADNGALQVTYNGLPLYFYSGDSAPGDATGVYTNWTAVKP
jgi:predicted lipoprotein with Yx(FWY)xxD motif